MLISIKLVFDNQNSHIAFLYELAGSSRQGHLSPTLHGRQGRILLVGGLKSGPLPPLNATQMVGYIVIFEQMKRCLLYTSDAADE